MKLIYDILQIEPCSKWNIFKRIKTYFKIRTMKRNVSKDIYNWDSFFVNIIDFCNFTRNAMLNFDIPLSDNCDIQITILSGIVQSYIMRFNTTSSIHGTDTAVSILYLTNEPDRINVRTHTSLGYNDMSYDLYLERDKMPSYKHDSLKNDIITFTMDYMNTETLLTLDAISSKYIYQRKESINEDETEDV